MRGGRAWSCIGVSVFLFFSGCDSDPASDGQDFGPGVDAVADTPVGKEDAFDARIEDHASEVWVDGATPDLEDAAPVLVDRDTPEDPGVADSDAPKTERLAQKIVGATGGTVTSLKGVSIEVPAGALTEDVVITIDEISGAEPPPLATSVGPTIQIGPEGQTFAVPVKVVLPWTGGAVPVVIAHSARGGADWTTLSAGAGSDATHVWAKTDSFSWFQPVYFQGAPDAPIVLNNDGPVFPKAVAIGDIAANLHLYGTGFRTDTIVTLFKDGVTTADVSPVHLTSSGLKFTLPPMFTDAIGLITIQARNPQASVGDATSIIVIATPVLASLSPPSRSLVEEPEDSGFFVFKPFTVDVKATSLPEDFSLCGVSVSLPAGELEMPAYTSSLAERPGGFSFRVEGIQSTGTHRVALYCSGVGSNSLSLDITK